MSYDRNKSTSISRFNSSFNPVSKQLNATKNNKIMDTRTTNSSLIPLRWYASLFPLLIDSQFAFSTPYSFALYLSLSPFYTVWLSSTISTRTISLPRSRSISLRPVRHALDPSHAHCITDTDRMRFRREWTIVRGKSFHRIRARFISIEGNVTKRESVSFWAYRYARVGRIHIYIYISVQLRFT